MRKVVFITGSSSGIGNAIARLLLQQNYKVYASARNIDTLDSLKGLGASVLTLDVAHEESIKNAITEIEKNEGKLDVLINNAGYGQFGVFEYISDQQARRQMDVNVFGLASVIRTSLPLLRQSSDARIINISSIAGKVSLPFGAWYSASKFAVDAITDSLRMELKPQHIQLISIQPGPIESNFGSITRQNMVVPEPDGVYDSILKRAQEYFDNDFKKTGNTGPDQVANVVWKAITAQRPKARYRVTPIAHLLVIMKNILPTKWLDYVFLKQMGLSPKSLQNGSPERNYPDHRPEKQ